VIKVRIAVALGVSALLVAVAVFAGRFIPDDRPVTATLTAVSIAQLSAAGMVVIPVGPPSLRAASRLKLQRAGVPDAVVDRVLPLNEPARPTFVSRNVAEGSLLPHRLVVTEALQAVISSTTLRIAGPRAAWVLVAHDPRLAGAVFVVAIDASDGSPLGDLVFPATVPPGVAPSPYCVQQQPVAPVPPPNGLTSAAAMSAATAGFPVGYVVALCAVPRWLGRFPRHAPDEWEWGVVEATAGTLACMRGGPPPPCALRPTSWFVWLDYSTGQILGESTPSAQIDW
jgi:hypothetical protein